MLNEEALALLQRGISLMGGDRSNVGKGKGNYEDVVHLWEQLGDLLELKAQHENALQGYKKARTQQPQINLIWQARLHRKRGNGLAGTEALQRSPGSLPSSRDCFR